MEPCDPSPDDTVIAAAIERLARDRARARAAHDQARWSGLRTFSPDRVHVVGEDPTLRGLLLARGPGRLRDRDEPGGRADRGRSDRARPERSLRCVVLSPARFAPLSRSSRDAAPSCRLTATRVRTNAQDAGVGGGLATSYTAKDIMVLEGLEPVRRRPGMYIGGVESAGLHHLLWEIVDNSRRRGDERPLRPHQRHAAQGRRDGHRRATTAAASRSTCTPSTRSRRSS